jgi:hypothetical protein
MYVQDETPDQLRGDHDAWSCVKQAEKNLRAQAQPAIQRMLCVRPDPSGIVTVADIISPSAPGVQLLVVVHDADWPTVRDRLFQAVERATADNGVNVIFVGMESNQRLD